MATKRTLEELAEIVNNHLANLQRIGVNRSGDLLEILNDVQSELMDYILSAQKSFGSAGLDSGTNKRLKIIKAKIEYLLNQAYSQGYYAISAQAAGLAENEAKHAASLVRAMTGTAVAQVGKLTVENIVKYGRFNGLTLAEMFNSMSVKDADKIYTTVAKNILSGSTPQSLKKAVQHVFDVSNYTAKTVGLTCANGISNDARLATFAQNADVVKGVEILNSLDGRTCPTCAQIGGLRFAVDAKDIPVLPIHPRCRCCYIPVTVLSDMSEVTRPAANADFMAEAKRAYEAKHPDKDWDVLAESSKKRYYHQAIHAYEERTGKPAFRQVPGSMTFAEYFEPQSEQFKRDWLKPTRYKLYQKGLLSLNDMMDPATDRLFTLAELKKRDIDAFKKAGLM
jgi:SPP1 gp7 family putative phage head morphogenesis protein|nr:MAG TPA_asm: minor capsid protein [Caudoviricetes sp.]